MDIDKMIEQDLVVQKKVLEVLKSLNSMPILIENQTAIIADIEKRLNIADA